MVACASGNCKIDVYIRVVEAAEKSAIHTRTNGPSEGDLVAAGAIYCSKKNCLLQSTLEYNIQL